MYLANYSFWKKITTGSHYKIYLKRGTNSCFFKNYNLVLLKEQQAKINLKPMYNYYEAISYMKAYFSKSESEMSRALKQVVNKITNQNFKTKKGI